MKISTERLKEIIKEELEAHALLEQPGNPDSPPGNPDDKPDVYDAPEHVISGSELPKSWKQQQQMAKKGRVFVRRNQGYWHLTYLVRLAAPAYKKNLKPNSRKSRRLVATMVKKMQNGKSTLRTRQDYGRVVNYLDLHFGRKNMAEPTAIQGYWKHLPDKEAAIKNRAKYVSIGIVPDAQPSEDVLNNKVVVVVARNSAYGLTLQQAQALRKYISRRMSARSWQDPDAADLADTIQAAIDKRPKGSPASRWTLVPDILRKHAKGLPLKANEIKVLQGLAGQSGVNQRIKAGLDKIIGEY